MPEIESPETQELEISMPQISVPPAFSGETEKFGATIHLEDSRRRDAMIEDLSTQLAKLRGTSAEEIQSRLARSPSARKRQRAIIRLTKDLQGRTKRYGD